MNEYTTPDYEEFVEWFRDSHEPCEIVEILELSSSDLVEAFRYHVIKQRELRGY